MNEVELKKEQKFESLSTRDTNLATVPVPNMITNLISNTTPKGSTPSDPFWEKAEGLFLQSIFYYVWLEVQPAKRNFETVLKLLGEAEVTEQGKASKLDVRMKFLEESSPLGANHPAVKQYNKCMRGAGDTVRSIIISANSRLAFLENKQVLRLLSKDELNLSDIGIGVNGDGETKTALFCVIPDSDKSYNFIIGMLYTQIFQELYYQADFNCGGRLPIHVTFMMLGDTELSRRFSLQDEAEQKAKIDREQANELEYVDESQKADNAANSSATSGNAGGKPVRNPEREKPKWEDTITNRMLHWSYTPEQKEELKMALAAGVPKATILTYFYPEVTVEKMSSYRQKQ